MFRLIRAKNRFETNNRDVLVNFRYGDVLVAEAQIGVDMVEEKEKLSNQAKLNNAISHFIYELERSIFGPTLELMMQYEDIQRPDITVTFEAEGQVYPRTNDIIESAKSTKRV